MTAGRRSRARRFLAAAAAGAVVLSGCSGPAAEPAPRVSTTPAAGSLPRTGDGRGVVRRVVDGRSMAMTCVGTGSPTVVVIPGLGSTAADWAHVDATIGATTRVCAVDRPGLGVSQPAAPGVPATVGRMAIEIATLLVNSGVRPPYVLVAHSFGGLVARAFVTRYADAVGGVLFVDASTLGELRSPYFRAVDWTEGGRQVDISGSEPELAAARPLGSIPEIVLTRDATGALRQEWYPLQTALARASTDHLHVVVRHAGHVIQDDNPAIVVTAADVLVRAVRTHRRLRACRAVFAHLGGRCVA